MNAAQQVQAVAASTPKWLDATIIFGAAVASWLAPIASLVAIVWGCLQIYGWFEKRRKYKEGK